MNTSVTTPSYLSRDICLARAINIVIPTMTYLQSVELTDVFDLSLRKYSESQYS